MLNVNPRLGDDIGRSHRLTEEARPDDFIDLERLLAAARRQVWVVAGCAAAGLVLGLAYLLTAQPLYTASTHLLIDPLDGKGNSQLQVTGLSDLGLDSSAVDSQVELLKSEKITSAVAEKLNLAVDPEFMAETTSPVDLARGVVRAGLQFVSGGGDEETSAEEAAYEREREIIETLKENVKITRLGLTYVLEIDYTSPFPELSARIANAFADAYLTDQLDAKYEATRRASGWLHERIAELKQQALESDLAIQRFRAEHNLITAGGTLVSEQQLAEVNSQLILVRAERASAEAKWKRIRAILQTGQMEAAVTEALDNPVINELRASYLESSKRESEISDSLGSDHQQAVRLRNEMREYERLIFDELGRIAQSYESDYQVAQTRVESIEADLSQLERDAAATNTTQVTLRELEREAETYRNLYETFLQRYQEAVQQQSFPVTEARVITNAARPVEPSHPRKALVLALMLAAGSSLGAGFGAYREFRERTFRTPEQVHADLDLEFLGTLPAVRPVVDARAAGAAEEKSSARALKRDPVMRHVLNAPLSAFAETLRSAKVAADLTLGDRSPKIIGVVSVLPGEGKSTVAKNFASLLAHLGTKTLLIDGDLRNPGLSRAVAPHAEMGLVEALQEGEALTDFLMIEPDSRLVVLPAVSRRRVSHTNMLLASPQMKALLARAGGMFDYIVVDLPPLGPVVDVRAAARHIDAFVFVTEWGRTARKLVRTTLATESEVREKTLGVILNKVQTDKMHLYGDYGSKNYYYSKYSTYYQNG